MTYTDNMQYEAKQLIITDTINTIVCCAEIRLKPDHNRSTNVRWQKYECEMYR